MIRKLLNSGCRKPLVFGHRGASEEYPENTILAFEMAIQQGAIGIETDLQYTKDRHIVCFHDKHLGRLTQAQGRIANLTLKELSNIRIKHNHIAVQPIPTLGDLLDWLPKGNLLFLELKDRRFSDIQKMDAFVDTLAKHNVIDSVILASFNKTNLEQAKRVLPSILTCQITLCNSFPNAEADILTPFYPLLLLNRSYIREAHRKKKFVSAWDSHPEDRIAFYLAQDIDILTGNNPGKILESLLEITA